MDVVNYLDEVIWVADVAVPIFAVPDGGSGRQSGDWRSRRGTHFAACALGIADFAGGELFPGSHDFGDGPSVHWLEEDVDVIGHYDPGEQAVTLGIENQQGALHHVGYGRVAQDAGAVAGVDPGVDALAAFGAALFGGEGFQFGVQTLKDRLREAVGEMKGDMLGHVGTLKVGEVAAAMPRGSGIRSANREIGVPGSVLERFLKHDVRNEYSSVGKMEHQKVESRK